MLLPIFIPDGQGNAGRNRSSLFMTLFFIFFFVMPLFRNDISDTTAKDRLAVRLKATSKNKSSFSCFPLICGELFSSGPYIQFDMFSVIFGKFLKQFRARKRSFQLCFDFKMIYIDFKHTIIHIVVFEAFSWTMTLLLRRQARIRSSTIFFFAPGAGNHSTLKRFITFKSRWEIRYPVVSSP